MLGEFPGTLNICTFSHVLTPSRDQEEESWVGGGSCAFPKPGPLVWRMCGGQLLLPVLQTKKGGEEPLPAHFSHQSSRCKKQAGVLLHQLLCFAPGHPFACFPSTPCFPHARLLTLLASLCSPQTSAGRWGSNLKA